MLIECRRASRLTGVSRPYSSAPWNRTTTRPLIAIVDDDLHFRRALKRLVSSWGIDAETFASGHEFIDMLEQTPSFTATASFSIVQMPG